MLQIINISEARNNLSKLVKKVKETKQPIVIVQDSNPAVVIYPYNKISSKEDYLKKLLTIKGGWFSEEESKEIRLEVEKKLSNLFK